MVKKPLELETVELDFKFIAAEGNLKKNTTYSLH